MPDKAPGRSNWFVRVFNWFVKRFKDETTQAPQSKKDYWSAIQSFWASLQSIALIIALAVGGLWTYKTFNDLGSVNSSRAALDHLTLENEEKRKNDHPALNLELEATQLSPRSGDKNLYLSIVVTVKNVGAKIAVMCFEDPDPIYLQSVPQARNRSRRTPNLGKT